MRVQALLRARDPGKQSGQVHAHGPLQGVRHVRNRITLFRVTHLSITYIFCARCTVQCVLDRFCAYCMTLHFLHAVPDIYPQLLGQRHPVFTDDMQLQCRYPLGAAMRVCRRVQRQRLPWGLAGGARAGLALSNGLHPRQRVYGRNAQLRHASRRSVRRSDTAPRALCLQVRSRGCRGWCLILRSSYAWSVPVPAVLLPRRARQQAIDII